HKKNYLAWTPALLALTVVTAYLVEEMMAQGGRQYVDVGGQDRPQLVFFGAEHFAHDLARFRIPIEGVARFFFVIIALTLVGPGQELGRALNLIPNRVRAYTLNILGSVAGIVLFALFSWLHLSPFWWFLPVALGLAYFLLPRPLWSQPVSEWGTRLGFLLLIPLAAGIHAGTHENVRGVWLPGGLAGLTGGRKEGTKEYYWSPDYRIDYTTDNRNISVNLIGHQAMYDRDYASPEYALPHLLNRDARRVLGEAPGPFEKVLIIG